MDKPETVEVPREPTKEMMIAAFQAFYGSDQTTRQQLSLMIWRAMLSAAPPAPSVAWHPLDSLSIKAATAKALDAVQPRELAHDMAAILQTACDADEADPWKLLNEIAQIASKHPWLSPLRPAPRRDEKSLSTEESRKGIDNQRNYRREYHPLAPSAGGGGGGGWRGPAPRAPEMPVDAVENYEASVERPLPSVAGIEAPGCAYCMACPDPKCPAKLSVMSGPSEEALHLAELVEAQIDHDSVSEADLRNAIAAVRLADQRGRGRESDESR